MAHVFADLVKETTTTTGTGALTLDGAASSSFRAFSDVCSNNDTAWVAIRHQTAGEWEIALGTWATGGTLTRTTTIQSSNGGSAVDFSAGTKDVFITAPADKAIVLDGSGVATIPTPFKLGAVSVTATGTELNYVAGVTSAIQTQLNAKAPLVSPSFTTPDLGTPSAGVLTNCTGLPLSTGITGTLGVANGGTGRTTGTTAYALVATGTTATGAQQTLAAGATTEILVGGGASALPVWTTATGSGAPVRATSPTLVTPALGVATATSINKVALTAPATGSTLTVADGKTLTASNTLTLTATDGSTLAVGAGGTLGTGAFNPHLGYQMMANGILALDPVDSTTYYYGSFIPTTVAGFNKIYVPKAGTIKSAYIFITNVGTAGTSETSTISLRLNNTTDTTISSSVTTNASFQTFSNTSLSVAVVAGDYIEFKWVSPAYVTNPTQVRFFTQIFIE